MKSIPFLIAIFAFSFASSQSKEEPKTEYRVTKEYDENGNLIRYDSSAVSYGSAFRKHIFSFNQGDSISNLNLNDFFNFSFNDSVLSNLKIWNKGWLDKWDSLFLNQTRIDSILEKRLKRFEKMMEKL